MFRQALCVIVTLLTIPSISRAEFIITIAQEGADVVASYSGSINTAGLSFIGPAEEGYEGIEPYGALFGTATGTFTFWTGITGPSSIGVTNVWEASSVATGDVVFFDGSAGQIGFSEGYISGTTITGTMTWDNATIGSLGLTPGTCTWTWGSGADADSLVVDIEAPAPPSAVPEPSTLTLLGTAAVTGLGFFGWRRRKPAAACPRLPID